MPKTNRDLMKRTADQALGHLQEALDDLGWLRNIYAGGPSPKEGVAAKPDSFIEPVPGFDHPEHRQAVEAIGALVLQAHEVLKAFRTEVM